jgi:hypothetical protein
MKISKARMLEIIQEETRKFITEQQIPPEKIKQLLKQEIINLNSQEPTGHAEVIEEAVLLASQSNPAKAEELLKVITLRNSYIKSLSELINLI